VGIQPGDVVVAVDGNSVLGLSRFVAALYLHPTDQLVRIDILRGAQKLSFNVPAKEARERINWQMPPIPRRATSNGSAYWEQTLMRNSDPSCRMYALAEE